MHATVESLGDTRATLDIGSQKLVMRSEGVPGSDNPVSVIVRPESIAIVTSNTGLEAIVRARTYLGDKFEYEVSFG